MKILFTSLLLLGCTIQLTAQNYKADRKEIVKSERKANMKKGILDENVNPNTLNYDLRYARLDLDLDPAQQYVSGTVTHHFKMLENSNTIYFDMSSQLNVDEVKYHGQNLTFQKIGTKELKINFPAQVSAQTLDSLSIKYNGVPDSDSDAFSASTQNGTPILATLSEPFGAREWWPTKQSLNDKIEKYDIKITTPSQYSVGSNGKLMSETILPNGKKLTFWQTNYPMPAYLFALGITNYTKINDTFGTGANAFPYLNYLYPSSANNPTVLNNLQWTKDCMATFEEHFGLYPFRDEKYGHMQFSWGGGMEHTTMSSMGGFGKGLIAHELAHQWFGDKVTCGAWNDIWLNEGFATFGEHLIYEKLLMSAADFQSYLDDEISYITQNPGGSVYVPEGQLDFYRIFSGRLSYSKGGYVVRMLKWKLGDQLFFDMLKAYHQQPQFSNGYAKTESFLEFLNAYTGQDFTTFFNQWIYGEGFPTYTIRWRQSADNTKLTLKASQTQSHSSVNFYEMPLPIKVTGTSGQVAYLVLNNNSNDQFFYETVNFPISSIAFNYDRQILTKNATVIKDNALAVSELSKSNVSLYPNPTKNDLKISGLMKSTVFEIYSIDGKLIKKGTAMPDSKINVSTLSPGSYLIKLENQTIKFIKD